MARGQSYLEPIGFDDLDKALGDLPQEVSFAALRDINKAGAIEFQRALKVATPEGETGRGVDNIKIARGKKDPTSWFIGVHSDAWYLRFLETGTELRKTKGSGNVSGRAGRDRAGADKRKQFKSAKRGKINSKGLYSGVAKDTSTRATKLIMDQLSRRLLGFLKRRLKRQKRL
jgi:HK97 gp10 family phage protein